MQKKLIALAVAGLASTAAFAQSNVTIYGVMDAGFVHANGQNNNAGSSNAGNNTFNGIQSGVLAGSRLGFRGEEGLGNGLKAVFTLEYGVENDVDAVLGSSVAGALRTRQAFVGLQHAKYGTLSLGRQYAPGFYAMARNDVLASSASAAPLNILTASAAATTMNAGSRGRWDNSIAYASPTWAGFSGRAIYSFGEANTSNGTTVPATGPTGTGENGRFGLGVNYANGPINVDFAWHKTFDHSFNPAAYGLVPATSGMANPAQDNSIDEFFLGGSYDFKIVKVKATWQRQNDNNSSATIPGGRDAQVWSVGAEVPVFGNGTVHGGYSKLTWNGDQGAAGRDGDTHAWAVGYTHALSKRTTLYTTYTRVDNDANSGAIIGNGTVRDRGEAHNIFTAGISHAF